MVDYRNIIGEAPAALTAPAPTFNPAAAPDQGVGGFLPQYNVQDPNLIRMLAQMGSSFSQGKPAGQAIGGAADVLARNRAMQAAAAQGSERQASFMDQLIRALKGDPLGKNLFGDKEDMNTLDSATIDNKGITIKAPNPFQTKAFGDVTDSSLESQPSRRTETEAFPFL